MKNLATSHFPELALKENMDPITKDKIPSMPQIPSSDWIARRNDINENKVRIIPISRYVCLSGSMFIFEMSISYGSIVMPGGALISIVTLLTSNS